MMACGSLPMGVLRLAPCLPWIRPGRVPILRCLSAAPGSQATRRSIPHYLSAAPGSQAMGGSMAVFYLPAAPGSQAMEELSALAAPGSQTLTPPTALWSSVPPWPVDTADPPGLHLLLFLLLFLVLNTLLQLQMAGRGRYNFMIPLTMSRSSVLLGED